MLVKEVTSRANSTVQLLRNEGAVVDYAATVADAMKIINSGNFDAILVDVAMKGDDDRPFLKWLRRFTNSAIVVISDHADFESRVSALANGADDFLLRPINDSGFAARIRTQIELNDSRGLKTVRIGDLEVDSVAGVAKRNGQIIDLTHREFALLVFLAQHAGRVVSRKEIKEHVFESDGESETNLVDVYIGYLRKKIESMDEPRVLHTMRGRGYMLCPQTDDGKTE